MAIHNLFKLCIGDVVVSKHSAPPAKEMLVVDFTDAYEGDDRVIVARPHAGPENEFNEGQQELCVPEATLRLVRRARSKP